VEVTPRVFGDLTVRASRGGPPAGGRSGSRSRRARPPRYPSAGSSLALPELEGPVFGRPSSTWCARRPDRRMGLIVNRPLGDLPMASSSSKRPAGEAPRSVRRRGARGADARLVPTPRLAGPDTVKVGHGVRSPPIRRFSRPSRRVRAHVARAHRGFGAGAGAARGGDAGGYWIAVRRRGILFDTPTTPSGTAHGETEISLCARRAGRHATVRELQEKHERAGFRICHIPSMSSWAGCRDRLLAGDRDVVQRSRFISRCGAAMRCPASAEEGRPEVVSSAPFHDLQGPTSFVPWSA